MQEKPILNERLMIQKGEIFDPELAIQEVLKYSKTERKAKLAEFKEKLAYQGRGLAKIQKEISEKIRKNPDTSYKELFEEVCRLGEKYGMNDKQKETASLALEKYEEIHHMIEEVKESYPEPNHLYKELFGKIPKGEIEITVGPVTLYIKCHNLDDYENLYFVGEKTYNPQQKFDKEFKEWADETKGVQISGLKNFPDLWIAGENVTKIQEQQNPENESESTFIHEEQHSVYSLFDESFEENKVFENHVMARFKTTKNQEEKAFVLKSCFRAIRKEAEAEAKDEILAYYKDGTDFSEIVRKLFYEYNFLKKEKDRKFRPAWMTKNEEDKTLSEKIADEVYGNEYHEILEEATNAIKKMEETGYEKEEIIALLTHEPLAKWGKVVGRVLEK